jgi:hypothetical protein
LKALIAALAVFIIASIVQTAQIDGLIRETREAAAEHYELRAEYLDGAAWKPPPTENSYL